MSEPSATEIRVLIIEDAIPEREAMRVALEAERDIRVVGYTARSRDAVDLVRTLQPDVITLDVQLADGGGQDVIEQVMAFVPTPILVLSSAVTSPESRAAVEALVAGAVDALPKPESWDTTEAQRLRDRVRIVAGVHVVRHVRGRLRRNGGAAAPPDPAQAVSIVGIASSTGGPAALSVVLAGLGDVEAAVLVVQHLHADFVEGFAKWMARVSALPVEVPCDGVRVRRGTAYIAPGGVHLRIDHSNRISLDPDPPTLHRPSANVLFESLAARPRGKSIGVLLTGIGDDGAKGLLALRKKGATTFAQDEETSAVFGMPLAAQKMGAVQKMLPLESIAPAIKRAL